MYLYHRKVLSILFYHIGHNVDRLLWMNSPMNEWIGDKLGDVYQWAMQQSIKYDDHNEDFECNPNGDCWCKEEEWKLPIPKTYERCFSPKELKNIMDKHRGD